MKINDFGQIPRMLSGTTKIVVFQRETPLGADDFGQVPRILSKPLKKPRLKIDDLGQVPRILSKSMEFIHFERKQLLKISDYH